MSPLFISGGTTVGDALKVLQQGEGIKDYISLSTTTTEQDYELMSTALDTNPKIKSKKPAYSVLFLATTDTYIRFNDRKNVQVLIPANLPISFDGPIWRVFYTAVSNTGTLYVWGEM
jgi:hypothetical protein